MSMVKVKICGLRRVEDIIAVSRHKADFAGFVFAPSKRKVSPELARALRKSLKDPVRAVGVFVDMPVSEVAAIAEWCGMDVIQLHGNEDTRTVQTLRTMLPSRYEIWKAVHVRTTEDIMAAAALGVDRLVLDTYSPDAAGGTGATFNWKLIQNCNIPLPYFLAGGLEAQNVAEAIRLVHPYGVDVSTGVEIDDVKSEPRIEQFIRTVREMEEEGRHESESESEGE